MHSETAGDMVMATEGHVFFSTSTSTSRLQMHTPQWLLDTDNLTAPPFPASHSKLPIPTHLLVLLHLGTSHSEVSDSGILTRIVVMSV